MQLKKLPALYVLAAAALVTVPAAGAKEFLTDKEIVQIQDAQEIDKRTKVYLDAAALRLKTAEDRLNGKESAPGEPMEFFSVEDMLGGYYQIVRSVMLNLDGAVQNPRTDRGKLNKALRNLKDSSTRATKDLAILKRMAEDKKQEEVLALLERAIDITEGAREGSEAGIQQLTPAKTKSRRSSS